MITNIVDRLATRIRWGYLTAFLLLLISYILTFYITKSLLYEADQVDHTSKLMNKLDLVQSSITDAESSLRGYLVIKDENFLDLLKRSTSKSDSFFNEAKSLLPISAVDSSRMDTLRHLIDAKFIVLNSGLQIFRNNHLELNDSLRSLAYEGKRIMDSIRMIAARMQMTEKDRMIQRNSLLKSSSNLLKVINIVSLIVAILLVFYSIVTFNKENRAKQTADRNAEEFRNQLQIRISELHKLNSELVELKSIEKFASTGRIARTIAHEVRNPLTNINLAAEHLKSEIIPNSETDLLIEMITRNANRINQMISDLLNSTKASQLDFKESHINKLLDESLELAHDRIDLKGVTVHKDYEPGLCTVLVDADKIKIAFLNVIVNAIEAMEANSGILNIKTVKKNNRCMVIISDNGKGMTKEELTNLFEPYFTTKENGTGLGLTNTQNIILSHKASIAAESVIGKGTTFKITFGNNVQDIA